MKKIIILSLVMFIGVVSANIATQDVANSQALDKNTIVNVDQNVNYLPKSQVNKNIGLVSVAYLTPLQLCYQQCRSDYNSCVAQQGVTPFCMTELVDCNELCAYNNTGGF